MPGVWLPFIMCIGSYKVEIPSRLSHQIEIPMLQDICNKFNKGYIIKYEKDVLPTKLKDNSYSNRLPTRQTLKTSIQLGSPIDIPKELSCYRDKPNSIVLQDTEEMITENVDEVNQWLIENNATILKTLILTDKKRIDPVFSNCLDNLKKGIGIQLINSMMYISTETMSFLEKINQDILQIGRDLEENEELKIRIEIALLELYMDLIKSNIQASIFKKSFNIDSIVEKWKSETSYASKQSNHELVSEYNRYIKKSGFFGAFFGFPTLFIISKIGCYVAPKNVITQMPASKSNDEPSSDNPLYRMHQRFKKFECMGGYRDGQLEEFASIIVLLEQCSLGGASNMEIQLKAKEFYQQPTLFLHKNAEYFISRQQLLECSANKLMEHFVEYNKWIKPQLKHNNTMPINRYSDEEIIQAIIHAKNVSQEKLSQSKPKIFHF